MVLKPITSILLSVNQDRIVFGVYHEYYIYRKDIISENKNEVT